MTKTAKEEGSQKRRSILGWRAGGASARWALALDPLNSGGGVFGIPEERWQAAVAVSKPGRGGTERTGI